MNEKIIQILIPLVFIGACATSKNRELGLVKKQQAPIKAEKSSVFDSSRSRLIEPELNQVPPPKLRHEQEAPNHIWSGYGGEELVHRSLSTEVIIEVIDSNGSDIQNCYEKIAPNLERPREKDSILVEMTILGSGETKGVMLVNSSVEAWLSPPLEKCLSNKISKWKFPRSQSKQLTIQQQFLLSP